MINPWSINRCKNCNRLYCEECSEAQNYGDYCSPKCEREAAEEALRGGEMKVQWGMIAIACFCMAFWLTFGWALLVYLGVGK